MYVNHESTWLFILKKKVHKANWNVAMSVQVSIWNLDWKSIISWYFWNPNMLSDDNILIWYWSSSTMLKADTWNYFVVSINLPQPMTMCTRGRIFFLFILFFLFNVCVYWKNLELGHFANCRRSEIFICETYKLQFYMYTVHSKVHNAYN